MNRPCDSKMDSLDKSLFRFAVAAVCLLCIGAIVSVILPERTQWGLTWPHPLEAIQELVDKLPDVLLVIVLAFISMALVRLRCALQGIWDGLQASAGRIEHDDCDASKDG